MSRYPRIDDRVWIYDDLLDETCPGTVTNNRFNGMYDVTLDYWEDGRWNKPDFNRQFFRCGRTIKCVYAEEMEIMNESYEQRAV